MLYYRQDLSEFIESFACWVYGIFVSTGVEAVLVVFKTQREDSNLHLWINELTLEPTGTVASGIVPVLRARLLRYEQAIRRGSPASTPDLAENAMSLHQESHRVNPLRKETNRLRDRRYRPSR